MDSILEEMIQDIYKDTGAKSVKRGFQLLLTLTSIDNKKEDTITSSLEYFAVKSLLEEPPSCFI
jgi:hypothetical protein